MRRFIKARILLNKLFKLVRINNLLLLALTQYFVRAFLIGPAEQWIDIVFDLRFFLLSFSTVLIAAAGYVINDYYDVKIDIINKPHRVVVGKSMSRRTAMVIHFILNLLAISLGFILSWKIGIINLGVAFLMWLYSNLLKRLPLLGNITIAFLTALAVYLVSFYYQKNQGIVFIFCIFSFFISLVREIIKDMEDLKGDATHGCKTLPILWGIRKTKFFLYILTGFFLFSMILAEEYFKETIKVYFIAFIFCPLIWFSHKLIKADTIKDYKYLSTLCKLIMLSGVISMIFFQS
jgi:4-hydroxybenzoate polyprenyltransferase